MQASSLSDRQSRHGWTFWQKVLFLTPLREMVQALHMTFSSVSQRDKMFTLKWRGVRFDRKMWELYIIELQTYSYT